MRQACPNLRPAKLRKKLQIQEGLLRRLTQVPSLRVTTKGLFGFYFPKYNTEKKIERATKYDRNSLEGFFSLALRVHEYP